MNTIGQEAAVYTDFSQLESLKAEAQANPNAALEEVAQQFESLFMQMMLKSMRDATLKAIFSAQTRWTLTKPWPTSKPRCHCLSRAVLVWPGFWLNKCKCVDRCQGQSFLWKASNRQQLKVGYPSQIQQHRLKLLTYRPLLTAQ